MPLRLKKITQAAWPIAAVIVAVALTALYDYLLFHVIAEFISIIIAVLVAVLAVNSRRQLDNGFLLFLGVAFFYIAVIDLFHTLTYAGMDIIPGYGANSSTQLWLAARFMQALSLLLALYLFNRRFSYRLEHLICAAVTIFALAAVFYPGFFPDAYRPDLGLTNFKILSEYIIAVLFFSALVGFYLKKRQIDRQIFLYLQYAIAAAILSELFFTLYTDVYGILNLTGHLIKIISYYLIYLAVVKTGLVEPQRLIFKKLSDNEERLKLSEERLKLSEKTKSEFVYFVSHQLKNPLSSVLLATELLYREAARVFTQRQKSYLDDIRDEAKKMTRLITALLNLSKLELGTFTIEPEPMDLSIQFNELIRGLDKQIKRKKLVVKKEFPPRLPIILMDANVFNLIYENILSNAIRYTDNGGTVTVKIITSDNTVITEISDTGCGIPAEAKKKIFTKLFRAANARRKKANGTGLGLYIVKTVADKIGARVWFKSQENAGTTFYVALPLDRFRAE